MKQVFLKQTHKPPSFLRRQESQSQSNDAVNSKEISHQVRDDEPHWDYQGKRRDQVESSNIIVVWSIMLSLIIALLALIAHG